jgi:hypothetical protein
MFAMAASGIGSFRIANALSNDRILNPTAYCTQVLGINRNRKDSYKGDTDWRTTSIADIIRNKVYLGHMISQKQTTVSFKNKMRVRLPEEELISVLNTHEPLVEQDEFDIAQKVFSTKKRGNKHRFENIFVGILKCADCGSGLSLTYNGNKKLCFSYYCNRYRQHRKYCTTHYIHYDDVYKIVLESIREKQRFVKAHADELAVYAQKLANRGADIELKQLRSDLDKSRKRCGELDTLIQKLFEQVALGAIPQERFTTLSSAYESEQKLLKEKISGLEGQVADRGGNVQNVMRFFDLVRKHDEVTELTVEILREFIDSVVVHQAEGKRNNRTQKVIVNFRFIKENWFIF